MEDIRNEKLTTCAICECVHHIKREHCPACGSRRAFIATHSYEPYRVIVSARNSQDLSREVVRAYRSDIAFNFVTR